MEGGTGERNSMDNKQLATKIANQVVETHASTTCWRNGDKPTDDELADALAEFA
jgi:hypothetical protein